jgi:hypothetical protein
VWLGTGIGIEKNWMRVVFEKREPSLGYFRCYSTGERPSYDLESIIKGLMVGRWDLEGVKGALLTLGLCGLELEVLSTCQRWHDEAVDGVGWAVDWTIRMRAVFGPREREDKSTAGSFEGGSHDGVYCSARELRCGVVIAVILLSKIPSPLLLSVVSK